MKHARPDYDRIQDPLPVSEGGIPEDEPVFLLRAQDCIAARVVRIWAILQRAEISSAHHELTGSSYSAAMHAVIIAKTQADIMDKWPYKKIADLKEYHIRESIVPNLPEASGADEPKRKMIPTREICSLCHEVSRVGFWVPNEVWLAVVHPNRIHDILCVRCFTRLADEKNIQWDKDIKFFPVSCYSHSRAVGTAQKCKEVMCNG